jgi:hypothetical protein
MRRREPPASQDAVYRDSKTMRDVNRARRRLDFVARGNQIAFGPDGFASVCVDANRRGVVRDHDFVTSGAGGIEEQFLDRADFIGLDVVNQFTDRESLNHRRKSYAVRRGEASFSECFSARGGPASDNPFHGTWGSAVGLI